MHVHAGAVVARLHKARPARLPGAARCVYTDVAVTRLHIARQQGVYIVPDLFTPTVSPTDSDLRFRCYAGWAKNLHS